MLLLLTQIVGGGGKVVAINKNKTSPSLLQFKPSKQSTTFDF